MRVDGLTPGGFKFENHWDGGGVTWESFWRLYTAITSYLITPKCDLYLFTYLLRQRKYARTVIIIAIDLQGLPWPWKWCPKPRLSCRAFWESTASPYTYPATPALWASLALPSNLMNTTALPRSLSLEGTCLLSSSQRWVQHWRNKIKVVCYAYTPH